MYIPTFVGKVVAGATLALAAPFVYAATASVNCATEGCYAGSANIMSVTTKPIALRQDRATGIVALAMAEGMKGEASEPATGKVEHSSVMPAQSMLASNSSSDGGSRISSDGATHTFAQPPLQAAQQVGRVIDSIGILIFW